jgi:phasin
MITMPSKKDMPNFEIPNEMRDLAEKSVEQAKRAFEGFMGATQQATETAQDAASKMRDKTAGAAHQVVGFADQNVKAAFEHAQKLVSAKGIEDVVQLQSTYLKDQINAMQGQLKAMADMARDALTPKK